MIVKIGIDTMGFYIPPIKVQVSDIIANRIQVLPHMSERLHSAVKTTGQVFMRLTQRWQDSVCIAAESMLDMTKHIPSFEKVRMIISATETAIDASKPISAFLVGILHKAGITIPPHLTNYQTQHACAAGTISILQAASIIQSSSEDSTAIITTSDIARYEQNTTAEITQGSGAVSMYITKNPRLLELCTSKVGLFSEDVDDFFRPMNEPNAQVKGQYSMHCYINAVEKSLEDLARQYSQSIQEVLEEADYIIFHVPFFHMPFIVLRRILMKYLKYSKEQYDEFIERKYITDSADIISQIGNTYTAAIFFCLGSVLERHHRQKIDINNKKVLILSYGSGSTSLAIKGNTTPKSSEVVENWGLWDQVNYGVLASIDVYEEWVRSYGPKPISSIESKEHACVYLKEIRQDGYRVYNII